MSGYRPARAHRMKRLPVTSSDPGVEAGALLPEEGLMGSDGPRILGRLRSGAGPLGLVLDGLALSYAPVQGASTAPAPAGAAAAGPVFADRAAESGIDFSYFNGMTGESYMVEI